MKKQTLAVVVALVSSGVFASQCFARPGVLEANVPFAFEAGNKRFPAGQYQIESVTTGAGTLEVIRQVNGEGRATFSTIALERHSTNSQPQLIFHRYGNNFFLYQISNGEGKARQLFESKQEKEAAKHDARREVAVAVQ